MNALQQISGETVLVPAFEYNEGILEAWNAGKDFKIGLRGPYCSIRDIKYLKGTSSRVVITKDYFKYIVV